MREDKSMLSVKEMPHIPMKSFTGTHLIKGVVHLKILIPLSFTHGFVPNRYGFLSYKSVS